MMIDQELRDSLRKVYRRMSLLDLYRDQDLYAEQREKYGRRRLEVPRSLTIREAAVKEAIEREYQRQLDREFADQQAGDLV